MFFLVFREFGWFSRFQASKWRVGQRRTIRTERNLCWTAQRTEAEGVAAKWRCSSLRRTRSLSTYVRLACFRQREISTFRPNLNTCETFIINKKWLNGHFCYVYFEKNQVCILPEKSFFVCKFSKWIQHDRNTFCFACLRAVVSRKIPCSASRAALSLKSSPSACRVMKSNSFFLRLRWIVWNNDKKKSRILYLSLHKNSWHANSKFFHFWNFIPENTLTSPSSDVGRLLVAREADLRLLHSNRHRIGYRVDEGLSRGGGFLLYRGVLQTHSPQSARFGKLIKYEQNWAELESLGLSGNIIRHNQ